MISIKKIFQNPALYYVIPILLYDPLRHIYFYIFEKPPGIVPLVFLTILFTLRVCLVPDSQINKIFNAFLLGSCTVFLGHLSRARESCGNQLMISYPETSSLKADFPSSLDIKLNDGNQIFKIKCDDKNTGSVTNNIFYHCLDRGVLLNNYKPNKLNISISYRGSAKEISAKNIEYTYYYVNSIKISPFCHKAEIQIK